MSARRGALSERFIVHVGIGRHGMRVSRGLTSVTDERQRGTTNDGTRRDATRRDATCPRQDEFSVGSPGGGDFTLPICMNLITEFSFCRERETLVAGTALHRMLQNHRAFQPQILKANGEESHREWPISFHVAFVNGIDLFLVHIHWPLDKSLYARPIRSHNALPQKEYSVRACPLASSRLCVGFTSAEPTIASPIYVRSLLHWCFLSRERRWPGTGWLYIRALWRNAPFVVVRKLPRRRTVTFSRERVLSEVESCERSWTIAFHARFLLARRVGCFPSRVSLWIASINSGKRRDMGDNFETTCWLLRGNDARGRMIYRRWLVIVKAEELLAIDRNMDHSLPLTRLAYPTGLFFAVVTRS
ncbi:hypothetical protein DBV15_11559 [Temnothorax longispinosus]|uniref:Uncharacterized protein n=1 Tax=Temnothorax longispinosus TaxID=300112 RepID=A0A4S2KXB6_9HYME|nr:hypothetical protein DBV15_11559 [Temnothorax longispinosus]